jgi:hypothetical protein
MTPQRNISKQDLALCLINEWQKDFSILRSINLIKGNRLFL